MALQAQAAAGMAATSDPVQIHYGEAPAPGAALQTMNRHSNVNKYTANNFSVYDYEAATFWHLNRKKFGPSMLVSVICTYSCSGL